MVRHFHFKALKITIISISMCSVGCATQNKSVGLGAAIGAAGGALLGGIANPGQSGQYRTRNVVVGSAVGGFAGILAGSTIHSHMEKQRKEAFLKGQAAAPKNANESIPNLTTPKIETRWVEGQVFGNRYVEGHYEYIITEPVRWEKQ